MKKLISIIIRTLNEEKYLDALLTAINKQKIDDYRVEVIVVDSGSTDDTLKIVSKHQVSLTHISKNDFSFGRSLNIGCKFSKGDILVFISGHCIPVNEQWLNSLIQPIKQGYLYSYGKQNGKDTTPFSENQVFKRQYPSMSSIPQRDFFCNNANSAISRTIWKKYKFNENITGCEDMELAKRYFNDGGKLAYVAEAAVYHIHNENWKSIRNRYEREALALQEILPEVNLTIIDVINYFFVAVVKDLKMAFLHKVFFKKFYEIIRYRFEQYYGSYVGNQMTRQLSKIKKIDYFYPRKKK